MRSKTEPTKAAAKLHLLEVQQAMRDGTYVDPVAGKETVASYAAYWLRHHHARPSTKASYGYMLDRYVLPFLGKQKLKDLDYDRLVRWVNELKQTQSEMTGQTLSPTTVHGAHRVLKAMLSTAVKTKRLPYNPARGVPLPPKARPEWQTLSEQDLEKLLLELNEGVPRTLVLCAAMTGLRWSELAGLRWGDVLLNKGVIRVRHTLVGAGKELVEGVPKSARSNRDVPIPRRLHDELVALRTRHPSTDEGLVFTSDRGHPMRNSNWHRIHWDAARCRAGLPDLRMHDLRHNYATWLIRSGADIITVRDLLGHDSVVTTQLYSHSDADRMRAATERLFGSPDVSQRPPQASWE
ncbi:MAG: tyrosine-type recombinase/integrase [Oryzihumus sp.]